MKEASFLLKGIPTKKVGTKTVTKWVPTRVHNASPEKRANLFRCPEPELRYFCNGTTGGAICFPSSNGIKSCFDQLVQPQCENWTN